MPDSEAQEHYSRTFEALKPENFTFKTCCAMCGMASPSSHPDFPVETGMYRPFYPCILYKSRDVLIDRRRYFTISEKVFRGPRKARDNRQSKRVISKLIQVSLYAAPCWLYFERSRITERFM